MGAGKSIFSERLSRITGLELHHLDRLFWKSSEKGTGRREWIEAQEKIVSGEAWIVEGNYGATISLRLSRADTVIYLDFPTLSCFLGVIRRALLSRAGLIRKADIVEGCNDRLDSKFLRYALTFNRKHRKGILKGLSAYPHINLIVLKKRGEAERYLRRLATSGLHEPRV